MMLSMICTVVLRDSRFIPSVDKRRECVCSIVQIQPSVMLVQSRQSAQSAIMVDNYAVLFTPTTWNA
jgi:hypothetical protein